MGSGAVILFICLCFWAFYRGGTIGDGSGEFDHLCLWGRAMEGICGVAFGDCLGGGSDLYFFIFILEKRVEKFSEIEYTSKEIRFSLGGFFDMGIFRKDLEPMCIYCTHGKPLSPMEVACAKRGVQSSTNHCRRFRYDPLKRTPPRPVKADFSQFTADDFKL